MLKLPPNAGFVGNRGVLHVTEARASEYSDVITLVITTLTLVLCLNRTAIRYRLGLRWRPVTLLKSW